MKSLTVRSRIERLEALILKIRALIFQIVALVIGAGASTVVWRPGGVSHGNVFATWAEVVAAVAKMQGAIEIAVDTDLAAAIIPAGAWDLRPAGVSGPVYLVNGSKKADAPFVTIANAAVTIHGLSGQQDIQIDNHSTVDVITVTTTDRVNYYLRGFSAIFNSVQTGGKAFIKMTSGGAEIYVKDFGFISTLDGGTNAIQLTGGALDIFIEDAAAIDVNQISRTAGTLSAFGSSATWSFPAGFVALGAQASVAVWFQLQGFSYHGFTTLTNGLSPLIRCVLGSATAIVCTVKTPNGDANTAKGYAALSADRTLGGPGGGSVGSFKITALTAVGGGDKNVADQSVVDFWVHGEA